MYEKRATHVSYHAHQVYLVSANSGCLVLEVRDRPVVTTTTMSSYGRPTQCMLVDLPGHINLVNIRSRPV